MKEKSEIVNYLLNMKEPYILKLDDMQVEMKYCKTEKTLKKCMVNILAMKIRK